MLDGDFTQADIDLLLANVDNLDEAELAELDKLVSDLADRQRIHTLQTDLIAFCCHMQSDYKVGAHHKKLAGLLEDIEARRKDRICVSVPPRHGKSMLVSTYYAAWYLGRNPSHKVMLVSHTTDLAVDFGRKVRNIVNSDLFREVFPDVGIATDNKSAGRWNTTQGGEFYATGVGSALAGRGAHMLLIDDPHSEQDVLNGNYGVFSKAYEWFAYGARTRLMPGGAVAIVHCMTGDTGVLMVDGVEKPLRDVRPGDMVMSYAGGTMEPRKVLNWANQGPDQVYTLAMDNGNLVRANARHPFLVTRDGVETWTKVQDLRPGDDLVTLTGANASPNQTALPVDVRSAKTAYNDTGNPLVGGQNRSTKNPASSTTAVGLPVRGPHPENARHVYRETRTTRLTPDAHAGVPDTGVNGRVKSVALQSAARRLIAAVCAKPIIIDGATHSGRPQVSRTTRRNGSITTYLRGTVSQLMTMARCVRSKTIGAVSATFTPTTCRNRLVGVPTIHLPSITATKPGLSGPCYATHAICSSQMNGQSTSSSEQFSTSKIMEIVPSGVEDVFDIQVEGTENFIANGVVSHNTRWHQNDLIGQLVRDMTNNENSDQYEIFEFPAIMQIPKVDADGNETFIEKALWPEFFDLPALYRTKASMPIFQWNSQYQQTPTAEEAAIVKREWWRIWTKEDPPDCEYIIMSLDAAAETNNRADYTSITTWGVFFNEEEDMHNIILLNAIKERYEFPELKRVANKEYEIWQPDAFIVEKKSAGVALYQEMRRSGVPVQEYTPHRGSGDKMARLNSVADIIASGICWVPTHRWAEEVVEEIAGFPFMANDDHVDSAVVALMRFRQGGFLRLPTDEEDEELPYRRKVDYY